MKRTTEASLKRLLAAAALASLIAFFAVPSNACSLASCLHTGMEMRQDFAVTVTHDGKPLAGVAVQVTSSVEGKNRQPFSGITSGDGTVHVTNLPSGEYWLNAELLGISAAYECFHVSNRPSRKAKGKLTYEWGDEAPGTQRIAGKLIDSQPGNGGTPLSNLIHRIEVPISGAGLKLQNPTTGAVYTTTSDHNGDFAFDTIPTGTYVLHIEGGGAGERGYDATDLLIELNFHATRNALLLTRRDAGGGSCGGTYLDLLNSN